MPISWTSFYGLARVNNSGPEVKNWAATDGNPQEISMLFKTLELHQHTGATPMSYPGYNWVNPATPATPLLTQYSTGGYVAAGSSIGVRMSFVDQLGLETDASPEVTITMPPLAQRPEAPIFSAPVSTPVPGAIAGGTLIYALTKRLGDGETEISNVTAVTVPFDSSQQTSYVVPLQFDQAVADYFLVDSTDSVCLYRSTGYDAAFVRVKTFLATPDGYTYSYTDDGSIESYTQPPQAPTFGRQNVVNIDWSTISMPTSAYRFRIYVTQLPAIYDNSSLLQDYNLKNTATPVPNNISYYGTEALAPGFPYDFSQLMGQPNQVYLPTEAYGAPYYTQPANALGWPTWNFVFGDQSHTTPIFGSAYVDSSVGQLKLCLSTPGGIGVFTTVAGVGSGYAHPTTESGGHLASHIYAAPTGLGGPTQDLINNIISTPVAGSAAKYRIQATSVFPVTATPADLQLSSTSGFQLMPDMDTTSQWPNGISPDFPGQWFETVFGSQMITLGNTSNGQIISTQLYINGLPIPQTYTSFGGSFAATPRQGYGGLSFTFATPLTRSNNTFQVRWQLSYPGKAISYGGNVVGQAPRRYFNIKELF